MSYSGNIWIYHFTSGPLEGKEVLKEYGPEYPMSFQYNPPARITVPVPDAGGYVYDLQTYDQGEKVAVYR